MNMGGGKGKNATDYAKPLQTKVECRDRDLPKLSISPNKHQGGGENFCLNVRKRRDKKNEVGSRMRGLRSQSVNSR